MSTIVVAVIAAAGSVIADRFVRRRRYVADVASVESSTTITATDAAVVRAERVLNMAMRVAEANEHDVAELRARVRRLSEALADAGVDPSTINGH